MGLLERLSQSERGTSLTALSLQLGLPAATTHRLLNTFEELGYVQQDEELGRWYIGVKAFTVGNAFLNRRDYIATARAFMHKLMEESGETVNLAVLDRDHVVFVAQVESRELMRMIVRLGSDAPIHASGAGKALLATLPDQEVARILHKRGLERFTDGTIDTPSGLREELETIQRQGYALDDEEHAVGLRCVAATIHDEHGGPLAALSLSGPKARITDNRVAELGVMVSRAAAEITRALGGSTPAGEVRESA